MRVNIYAISAIIFLFFESCSLGFYYKPDPMTTDSNNTFISNGMIYVISQKPLTTVSLSGIKPKNGEVELNITYTNNGLDRIDAIPDSIKVLAYLADDDGNNKLQQIQTYSADQYIRKIQRQQNFALGFQAGLDSYNNSQAAYTTSTTTTSTISPNGTYVTKTTTTSTYDANKAIAANAISSQKLQEQANQFAKDNQSLSEALIRNNTLLRGQSVHGYVVIKTGKSFDETIYIKVPIGNEIHTFNLIPNK